MKRYKTKYPGVFYRIAKRIGSNGDEKVFYIVFRKNGKLYEEKIGRQYSDDMTPARASGIRSERIEGKRKSWKEIREQKEKEKKAKQDKWTIDRLFKQYMDNRPNNKAKKIDEGRYEKYLKTLLGEKEPKEIAPLDTDRIRINLLKALSPQTVAHILNLLTWSINFGVNRNLCANIPFKIQKPQVNNKKTEDLTSEQLKKLLETIEKDTHLHAGPMMKLVLFTGLRRGEMFKLKWDHLDFDKGFINIVDPKSGHDQKIPMNDSARELLNRHEKTESEYVFPGRGGKQRVDINHQAGRIKKAADLPEDFRALHGLRHVYASMLASSGKVDMYTLQKLLTHKSPQMTQRYAHLRDETLKKASNLVTSLITEAVEPAKSNITEE